GLREQVRIQHVGDEDRGDDLRHRGEQEEREGVAQRLVEAVGAEDEAEVLQAHEVALPADQVPVVQGDPCGVQDREEADQEEQQEEGADEDVRGQARVEPCEQGATAGGAGGGRGAGGGGHGIPLRHAGDGGRSPLPAVPGRCAQARPSSSYAARACCHDSAGSASSPSQRVIASATTVLMTKKFGPWKGCTSIAVARSA